jgi:hypothetical protein
MWLARISVRLTLCCDYVTWPPKSESTTPGACPARAWFPRCSHPYSCSDVRAKRLDKVMAWSCSVRQLRVSASEPRNGTRQLPLRVPKVDDYGSILRGAARSVRPTAVLLTRGSKHGSREGLSKRGIAARMVISERIAAGHRRANPHQARSFPGHVAACLSEQRVTSAKFRRSSNTYVRKMRTRIGGFPLLGSGAVGPTLIHPNRRC